MSHNEETTAILEEAEKKIRDILKIDVTLIIKAENLDNNKMAPSDIVRMVCKNLNVPFSEVKSKTRGKEQICHARKIASMLIYHLYYPRLSLTNIASFVGNKDHATIIYYRNKSRDLVETNVHFRTLYQACVNEYCNHYPADSKLFYKFV